MCIRDSMKGFGPRRIALMLVSGIKTAKNILIVFLLIGMLTALWRACGTMPVIICYAVEAIRPETIVVMTFLLTCGVSMLTGTSFGTAATMGAICMTCLLYTSDLGDGAKRRRGSGRDRAECRERSGVPVCRCAGISRIQCRCHGSGEPAV